MSTYSTKLKDPKWKALKSRLLRERGFLCEDCERQPHLASSLHLHHKYYDSCREPWEYPDDVFKLLCADCHELTTEALKSFLYTLGAFDGDQIVELGNLLQNAISDTGDAREVHNWLRACLDDINNLRLGVYRIEGKGDTCPTE